MIATIYARKSPVQNGGAERTTSVTRQVEHARAYANRKGWTVTSDQIYLDDRISGAEFEKRPGYMRLLNALKPQAPFEVLIVSELSVRETLTMGQHLSAGLRPTQVVAFLMPVFAMLTLMLATIGLHGVVRWFPARQTDQAA